jgi:SAM-dependent methyltransferase
MIFYHKSSTINNMPRHENDIPESDIISIATFAVPKFPENSAIIVKRKGYKTEQISGAEIVAAINAFADTDNNGKNRIISPALERQVKEDLSILFASVDAKKASYTPKIQIPGLAPSAPDVKVADVLVRDVQGIRSRVAQEVMKSLDALEINIDGKKVLDVGTRTGENAKLMRERGADVYAVEPDTSSLNQAIKLGNIEQEKAFPVLLQDMPEEHKGTFDVATCFLWNIPFAERENFTRSLAQAIKPTGQVIIGASDDVYVDRSSDINVEGLLRRHFHSVKRVETNGTNKCLFSCSDPREVAVEAHSAVARFALSGDGSGHFRGGNRTAPKPRDGGWAENS